MRRSRNPFRVIRIAAATLGTIAVVAIFGFIVWVAIAKAIDESGPSILWQVPLAFAVLFGFVAGITSICSLIARLWRMAERNPYRKEQSDDR